MAFRRQLHYASLNNLKCTRRVPPQMSGDLQLYINKLGHGSMAGGRLIRSRSVSQYEWPGLKSTEFKWSNCNRWADNEFYRVRRRIIWNWPYHYDVRRVDQTRICVLRSRMLFSNSTDDWLLFRVRAVDAISPYPLLRRRLSRWLLRSISWTIAECQSQKTNINSLTLISKQMSESAWLG